MGPYFSLTLVLFPSESYAYLFLGGPFFFPFDVLSVLASLPRAGQVKTVVSASDASPLSLKVNFYFFF